MKLLEESQRITAGYQKLVADLKAEIALAKTVAEAAEPDREGETLGLFLRVSFYLAALFAAFGLGAWLGR